MTNERRHGRFKLDRSLVDMLPDRARVVLQDCIVLQCESGQTVNALYYVADHPDFAVTETLDLILNPPSYEYEIVDGKRTWKAA